MVYRKALQEKDKYSSLRCKFARRLGNVIRHNLPCVYFDEASLNSFM